MKDNYIGERITALRLEKGISEYLMSKQIGRCNNYMNKIASGKIMPSLSTLQDICDFFGISLAQFFIEDEPQLSLTAMQITACLPYLTKEQLESLLVIVNSIKGNAC